MFQNVLPTPAHYFCAYLAQKGWVKRIYTQNIDGLHTHPNLFHNNNHNVEEEEEEEDGTSSGKRSGGTTMDPDLVVEYHGSLQRHDLVMYGDPLPKRFFDAVSMDFDTTTTKNRVDLICGKLFFGRMKNHL